MNYSIIDIETDGLIDDVTKIHCMSVVQIKDGKIRRFSLINYDDMKKFIEEELVIVGHNIVRYDIPVLIKILNVNITATLIDTLGLSWYLYPERVKHGLESWGEDLGVEKPKINDWQNLTLEEYIFRCESDTEINRRLFDLQTEYLLQIYDGSKEAAMRFIRYIWFKLDCAREQEEVKWKLDVAKCEENLAFLEKEAQSKVETLRAVMPVVVEYKDVSRPKAIYKKVKPTKKNPNPVPELTIAGQKWLELLKEKGFPEYHLGAIRVPVKEEPGNPGSFSQLKAWLTSIGWVPETFKYKKEPDGSQRAIPQLSKDGEPDICDSVKKLYAKVPELEALEGLFILRHRIGLLKGFLENRDKNDFLKAEVKGFTNTLRFQHTVIVNLPTIPKPYWQYVRGCLIAPDENHILCGSDMSGLEDNTKRHYMFYHDPEYVKEMMTPDFDAHLDIAVLSNLLSKEQAEEHKLYDKTKGKEGKSWKAIRSKAKKVNFAGVYGAGPPKIALTAGIPLSEAKILHTTYWKRNWSVKKIAEGCVVKTIGTQMWLLNPVSQFWYSLRMEKDRFSTLNQGTGVYCFDSWVRNVRKQGIKNCGQFHDEIISPLLKGTEEQHSAKLKKAIAITNEELKLNITLGISIDYGNSYAEIH